MARDLKTVVNESVFTAINGYDASTDKPMFNNLGNASTMTRTTDNWMHDLVGSTGISPLNSHNVGGVAGTRMGGVLITPRHMVFARHYVLPVNKIVYFYDRNNVRYDRVITANAYHGMGSANGDYYVAVLDSDLPSEIEPLKVFPPDFYKYLDPSQITLPQYLPGRFTFSDDFPIIHTDQEEKSLIARATSIDVGEEGIAGFDAYPDSYQTGDLGKMMYGTPIDTDLQAWREGLISGDSGTPHFALIDDELIFLGPTYTTARVDSIVNLRTHNDINKLIEDADTAAGFNTGYELTSYDMTGFKQYNIPDRAYTFIGDDISNGTLIQFRGSVTDHNSYHYSIPYAATSVVRTDPRDDSQTLYSVNGISTSNQKWVGAVYASNKRIYAAPHAANGPLIINTEDPSNVTVDYINVGYGLQARGIALQDNGNGSGAAYMTSYSGSESVKKFTFDSSGNESAVTSINYTVPTDPYETARGSLVTNDEAVFPFIYRSYWGAVNGGNDKIYGIPYGASQVQVIDLNNDTISFIDTDLTGLADYDTTTSASTDFYYLRSPQWNKYKGGVLASNGCIYSHGTHARGVLKIDTSDDSVTEIPYPYTIYSAMTAGYTGSDVDRHNSWGRQPASMFSVEGPDGKIYNTPWNLPYQIAIDPADDSISFNPLSAILDENSSGADLAWYTDGSLLNQQVFMAPGEADRVLEIGFDGYTPAAWSTVTPFSQASSSSSPSPSPSGTPSASSYVSPSPTPSSSTGSVAPSPTPSSTMSPSFVSPSVSPSSSQPAPTPSNSEVIFPSPTASGTPSPSVTASTSVTPSGTPDPSLTPSASISVTPSITHSPTPSMSIGASMTPSPSITPSSSHTATPTPSSSVTPSLTPTNSVTPSVSPSNRKERCVMLDYDVEDGPDRFIVTYRGVVIIDTGFIGNAAYAYRGRKRQVFIDALLKEGIDFSDTVLAMDGYPVVDTVTEGSKESTETIFNEAEAYVTIQSPVHDKPGWRYTLNCPMLCLDPTPTGTPTPTQTPTQTQTQTPTQTGTPTQTPTSTVTPTRTPSPSYTPSPSTTPQASYTPTPSVTPSTSVSPSVTPSVSTSSSVTPSVSPSKTPSPSITPSTSKTPSPSVTPSPSDTPSPSVTPSKTPSPSFSKTPSPSVSPSKTPSPSFSKTPSPSVSPSKTPSPSFSKTPSPSIIPPSVTPSGTPAASLLPPPSVTPSGSPSPSLIPNYSLFPYQTPYNEGTAVTIGLFTTNVPNGTIIPYTITGIDAGDLHESLTGDFTINNGSDTITLSAYADNTTEGSETFTITLDGPGTSADVSINDTSLDPTFSLVRSAASIDEGESVLITLNTTGIPNGTDVPYTITGIEEDDINQDLTGNFAINNNTASVYIGALEDSLTEGQETMTLTLDNSGDSIDVDINDTSVAPSPTPSNTPSPSQSPPAPSPTPSGTPSPSIAAPGYSLFPYQTPFNEGTAVTIGLFTTNIANGTDVPYTITGINAGDLHESLTGNFTINNGSDTITLSAYADNLTEGSEIFTITLDGTGISTNVSINDTSLDPTFSLVRSAASIDEGENVLITLTTTGIPNGTNVPYTISGIEEDDIDQDLTGNFAINNNTASVYIGALEDSLTEGTETMTLTLDNSGDSIDVVINDTSLTPSPSPTPSGTPSPSIVPPSPSVTPSGTPSPSTAPTPTYNLFSFDTSFNEGSTVSLTLFTTNVADGTNVPYTITGVSSSDIDVSLTGNLVVTSNQSDFDITALSDLATEGAETLVFSLDGLSESISFTVNDTSLSPPPSPTPSRTPVPSVTPSSSLPGGGSSPTPS